MARVEPAHDPALRRRPIADDQDRVEAQTEAIFAHRPTSQRALGELMASFGEGAGGTLPPRLIELCRLRIAFWNQCRSCMSLRYLPEAVDEDLVCSLERPEESEDLSAAERAALHYADLLASDHLAIDEATYDALREHFGEGEIVELGMYCAAAIGYGRLAASWHMVDHLDPRFQADGRLSPWGGGAPR